MRLACDSVAQSSVANEFLFKFTVKVCLSWVTANLLKGRLMKAVQAGCHKRMKALQGLVQRPRICREACDRTQR